MHHSTDNSFLVFVKPFEIYRCWQNQTFQHWNILSFFSGQMLLMQWKKIQLFCTEDREIKHCPFMQCSTVYQFDIQHIWYSGYSRVSAGEGKENPWILKIATETINSLVGWFSPTGLRKFFHARIGPAIHTLIKVKGYGYNRLISLEINYW